MDKEQEQHLSTIKQDLTRYPADDFPRRYPLPTANRADYAWATMTNQSMFRSTSRWLCDIGS